MRPKVVILASRFPYPLIKGDKVRLYYQIRELAVHFELHLICLNDTWPEENHFLALQTFCKTTSVHLLSSAQSRRNTIFHYFSKMPMQIRYFYDRHIHVAIKKDVADIDPDYIFVQLVRMAPYALQLETKIPSGLDFMDSMTLNDLAGQYLNNIFLKLLRRRERRLIKSYEVIMLHKFDHYFIISHRDRKQFSDDLQSKLTVLSNGVDTGYFKIAGSQKDPSYDLIFCGNLSYRPNIEAVKFIRYQILTRLSQVNCLVAGADPDKSLQDLVLNSLDIKGYQTDIRQIYANGKIMVVPIFNGSGQQNKVIEAMSCGIPCVATSFVNESLQAVPELEILIADDADEFITHIKNLFSHPEKRIAIGRAGRSFVERKFNWTLNTSELVNTITKELKK